MGSNKQQEDSGKKIVLVIGEKISSEVKEMRNNLKQQAVNNFTSEAIIAENKHSERERQRSQIAFSMNIVSSGETR